MTELPTGVPYPNYMMLYTTVYDYSTFSGSHGGGETFEVAGRSKFLAIHTSISHPPVSFLSSLSCPTQLADNVHTKIEITGADIMQSDLYNKLIRFFVTHLGTLKDVSFPNQ